MRIKALAVIAALAAPVIVYADNTTSKDKDTSTKPEKLGDAELQVMGHYHHVNQIEIDLGKLAEKRGSTQAVKDYGKTLVTDHQQNDKDLMAFAKKHGQKIPAEKPITDDDKKAAKDAKAMTDRLHTLKGAEFDREYLQMMVNDHEKELATIDTNVGMVTDSDLAQMVRDVKPVLQRHADAARDLMKNEPQASADQMPKEEMPKGK